MTRRYYYLAAIALLGILAVLPYANALDNNFVHDDNYQIVRNPFLHADQPLYRLFTTDVWGYTHPGLSGISNYYRPLQMLTYRWTALFSGLNPGSFHIVNLLFHILATLAAYAVFGRLTGQPWLAFSAAALFALHPIHSEAVDWISALPELGCALFFFVSFWLFLKDREESIVAMEGIEPGEEQHSNKGNDPKHRHHHLTMPSRAFLLASLFCFGLATLWKEMALTLPVIIATYTFIFPKEPYKFHPRLWGAARSSLPYWAVVAVYLGIRYQVLGFLSRVQHSWALSPTEYVLNLIELTGKYWLKLLLPLQLNAFYFFDPVHSLGEPRVLVSTAFIVLAIGLIVIGLRRAPLPCLAASWVFLTLVPVLNLRGVGSNVFTERYLYIPSLGFCLLMTWLASKALGLLSPQHRQWVAVTTLALVAILYGAQTYRRNRDWKNDFIFYSRAAQASPKSASMRNSLAHILRAEKGDLEGAEQQCLIAIELAKQELPPDRREIAIAYLNLANIHIQRQQYQKALETAESGLAMDNGLPNLHIVQGVALMYLGRLEQAHQILVEVNRNLPNDELVLHYLGVIALSRNQLEQAINYFRKALEVLPDYADAHNNLGATYVQLGRFAEALPHFQRAAELTPKDPMVHTNLGITLARLGRVAEARSQLQSALALSPNDSVALTELIALNELEHRVR